MYGRHVVDAPGAALIAVHPLCGRTLAFRFALQRVRVVSEPGCRDKYTDFVAGAAELGEFWLGPLRRRAIRSGLFRCWARNNEEIAEVFGFVNVPPIIWALLWGCSIRVAVYHSVREYSHDLGHLAI